MDTTNYSMHRWNNSSADVVTWFLKYIKSALISLLGHNYEHEQTDRTTKLSSTFSVGFLSSYHTHVLQKIYCHCCVTLNPAELWLYIKFAPCCNQFRGASSNWGGENKIKNQNVQCYWRKTIMVVPASALLDQIPHLRLMLLSSCSSECGIAEL